MNCGPNLRLGRGTLRRSFLVSMGWLAAGPGLTRAETLPRPTEMPSKTVRFLVPLSPGGGSDRIARFVASRFSELTGLSTQTENRPGGNMIPAITSMLMAPADGSTIFLLTQTPVTLNPVLHPVLPYDPIADIRPVALAYRTPAMLVVAADSPHRSLADLLQAARNRPGQVAVGHYAQAYRLALAMLARAAGVSFNLAPYKLTSQVLTDLIGGTLPAALLNPAAAFELIRAGRLRGLATTAADRLSTLPDVPTVQESGLPGFQFHLWAGFGVHGRTPEPVVRYLEDVLLAICRHPDFARLVAQEMGNEPAPASGPSFAKMMALETDRNRELARMLPAE